MAVLLTLSASALLLLLSSFAHLPAASSQLQQQQQQQQQLSLTSSSPKLPDDQVPAVIKFIGIQHGHPNEQVARESFVRAMNLVTNEQDVTIDKFDVLNGGGGGGLIEWRLQHWRDCNEPQVQQLLDTIRHPDSGAYTRDFKMHLGPEFSQPVRVEVEWRGPCENLGRKRNFASTAQANGTSETEQTDSNQLANSSLGGDLFSGSEATSNTTTLSPLAVTSESQASSVSDEPSPPSSTTEPPQTIPDLVSEDNSRGSDELTNSVAETSAPATTLKPFELDFGVDFNSPFSNETSFASFQEDKKTEASPTTASSTGPETSSGSTEAASATAIPTTTTEAVSRTNAGDAAFNINSNTSDPLAQVTTTVQESERQDSSSPAVAADIPNESTTDPTSTTTTKTTTTSGSRPAEEDLLGSVNEQPAANLNLNQGLTADEPVLNATNASSAISSSSPSSSSSSSASSSPAALSPHYGKYIGLTTGFFVFIAYLLCARAYRRQGMYELQEST